MITKADSKKSEITLIKHRIEEIKSKTDVITRFIFDKISICRHKENKGRNHRSKKLCLTAMEQKRKWQSWTGFQSISNSNNFLGKSLKWVIKTHESENCIPVPSGEFIVKRDLVDLTLAMLEEKKRAKNELLKYVKEFQNEREKVLEHFFAKETNKMDSEKACQVSYEERFNTIDSRLDRLDSALTMISQKLDQLKK